MEQSSQPPELESSYLLKGNISITRLPHLVLWKHAALRFQIKGQIGFGGPSDYAIQNMYNSKFAGLLILQNVNGIGWVVLLASPSVTSVYVICSLNSYGLHVIA